MGNSLVTTRELHINAQTPADLRANFSRIQQQASDVSVTLDDHETRIDILEDTVGLRSAIFDDTTAAGAPLYVSSAGHVARADADALATSDVIGLAYEAVTSGGTGRYLRSGFLTLANWSAIIGGATLTAGARYYLSGTVGGLTTTAPTAVGQIVVLVGIAISPTTLNIDLKVSVQL